MVGTVAKLTASIVAVAGLSYAGVSFAPSLNSIESESSSAGGGSSSSAATEQAKAEPEAAPSGCDGRVAPDGMVCIPGGPAVIGSDEHEAMEQPQHTVNVSTFFIDQREVTNGEYNACVEAGRCPERRNTPASYKPFLAANKPAIPISWYMANRYCVWLGKRLPTEAEWEKAARGGTEARTYPWGDEEPSCDKANFKSCDPGITHDVGALPAGAYGVYDMAGNGYEWVQDWASDCYDGCENACGEMCMSDDPQGPCGGSPWCEGHPKKVLRGGSWYWPADQMRGSWRRAERPGSGIHRLSFRCAASSEKLTRAPYWHEQFRDPPAPLDPPSERELEIAHSVRDDTDVLKIKTCSRAGLATHDCRDPMSYYKSNERDRGLFGRYIENIGGAYVGLGADQAYDFIAHAKSEWAFLFDYDPTVVRIHYMIGSILAHAETPKEFVAALRPANNRKLARWVRDYLQAHDRESELRPTMRMVRDYRGKLLYHYNNSLEGKPRRHPRFGWLAYQENFDFVRRLHAQKRVVIRKGNLLTKVALPDIARAAKELGVPVRVYYDSNAADQWTLTDAYRHNVALMPMDDKSVVLRTLLGSRWKMDEKWLYMVQGGQHLQRKFLHHFYTRLSYFKIESQQTELEHLRVIGLPPAEEPALTMR